MTTFMFGLTLGVLGALLLGTEEGRKATRDLLDSLPESLKHMGQKSSKEQVPDFAPPLTMPEETPHHALAKPEAPPPPPPATATRPDYLYREQ